MGLKEEVWAGPRSKNEGKRLGRLLDTCVNESECTDLKIGQEFDLGKNLYWSGMRRVGEEKKKKEKGLKIQKAEKSRGEWKWKVNKMLMKQKWKYESKLAINTLCVKIEFVVNRNAGAGHN